MLLLKLFTISLILTPVVVLANPGTYHTPLIEACCCSREFVDDAFDEVLTTLDSLTKRPYFRYFKANLNHPCPFWAVELICSAGAGLDPSQPPPCHVCTCDENEIPVALRTDDICGLEPNIKAHAKNAEKNDEPEGSADDYPEVTAAIDPTISEGKLKRWTDSSNMWFRTDTEKEMEYYDLVRNPESNTGYVGDGASRIWQAIYMENCFSGGKEAKCTAERAFFRLISGLHVSISTHISAYYYEVHPRDHDRPETYKWEPNVELFMRMVGKFPDRVDNLYFVYLFMLRALSKAKPFMQTLSFYTGNEVEDQATKAEMTRLLDSRLVCSPNFDEKALFDDITDSQQVLPQIHNHLMNITRLMDCTACEKCRLWGKVAMLGLSAAMKIVIEDIAVTSLQRSEVVAMINFLRQLSDSIGAVRRLLRVHEDEQQEVMKQKFVEAKVERKDSKDTKDEL